MERYAAHHQSKNRCVLVARIGCIVRKTEIIKINRQDPCGDAHCKFKGVISCTMQREESPKG